MCCALLKGGLMHLLKVKAHDSLRSSGKLTWAETFYYPINFVHVKGPSYNANQTVV